MRAVLPSQMRELEKRACDAGSSEESLMEAAGAGAAKFIAEQYTSRRRIALFCGPGNNGADALVTARHLLENEFLQCRVFIFGHSKENSLFAKQKDRFLQAGGSVEDFSSSLRLEQEWVCVDGLF